MKSPLAVISDCIFCFFIEFILSLMFFDVILYRPYSIIFAISLSIVLSIITVKTCIKNVNDVKIKKSEKKEYENAMIQLNFMSLKEQSDFFDNALKKQENEIFFPIFSFDNVNKGDIIKAFNKSKNGETVIVFSEKFKDEIKNFAKMFNKKIVLKDGEETFKLLKEANSLPKNKIEVFKEIKKHEVLKLFPQKKKARKFLAFGILFFVLSYFVPIKTYYVACGTVFLILALLLRMFGKEQIST